MRIGCYGRYLSYQKCAYQRERYVLYPLYQTSPHNNITIVIIQQNNETYMNRLDIVFYSNGQ